MSYCQLYIANWLHLIIEGKNFKFQNNLQRNFSICFLYCIVVTVQTRAFKVSMPINHCSQQVFSHRKRRIKVFCAFFYINQPTNQQHIILLQLVAVTIFSVQYNLGWQILHKTVCDECQNAFNSSTNVLNHSYNLSLSSKKPQFT